MPSVDDIAVIGTCPQPVLRNLRITQAYHAFLTHVDPTPDTPLGSGSEDWAVLLDRMHFIADLFRARHEDVTLGHPPFTPDQLRAMADGRTPDGDL